jgi:hypothetical protein
VGPFASRFFIAFDALSVSGAVVSRRLGRPRVRSFASRALPPGAVNPLPSDSNIASPEEVRRAVKEVAESLAPAPSRVALMLPDGLARIVLLDVPRDVEPLEFARFRLASSLPYPAGEAVIDGIRLPHGRFLAAAVRRGVVEEYEQALAPTGLVQDRLDLSPLAAVSALLRQPVPPGTLDVILGDAAMSMALHDAKGLAFFRGRRRDPAPDEMWRLRDETLRTLTLAGNGVRPRIRVVGSAAGAAIGAFVAQGDLAEAGWSLDGQVPPLGGAEHAWLGGALA